MKALIGDITPKAISAYDTNGDVTESVVAPKPPLVGDNSGNMAVEGEKVGASSWNHAGTWEERELTQIASDKLIALLLEANYSQPAFNSNDPSSLTSAIDAMQASLGGITGMNGGENMNSMNALEQLEASMSSVTARITKQKSIEGDAHIVLARGKKKHIYDFHVELEFEVVVEPSSFGSEFSPPVSEEKTENKTKKFKGTMNIPEIVPLPESTNMNEFLKDISISFKKPVSSSLEKKVNNAMEKLKCELFNKITMFEKEFKNL